MRTIEVSLSDGRTLELDLDDSGVAKKTPMEGAKEGLKTGMSIIGGAAKRINPVSYESMTGGIGQEFAQEAKREGLDRLLPSSGGVSGAVMDIAKESVVQGTYGGNLLGAMASGPKMPLLTETGRSIRKTMTRLKDPRIPTMALIQKQEGAAQEALSGVRGGASKQIGYTKAIGGEAERQVSERASSLKGTISDRAAVAKREVRQSFKDTKFQIERATNTLDEQLGKEADIASMSLQKKVTGFFRRNSDAYGTAQDEIIEKMDASRLTKGEAIGVLSRTLQRSTSEAEVQGGVIMARIQSLMETKYGQGNPTDVIPFKDFLNDIRPIWKSVKAFKSGGRYSHEEIPAAILQNEFGELLSELPGGDEFASLQKSYRPVISYMNRANAIIQPYKGEAYTKGAEQLVKSIATGEAAEVDKRVMGFLEKGTKRFGEGVGSITARARQVGSQMALMKDKLRTAKMSTESKMFEIGEESANRISRIDMASKGAQKSIESEVASLTSRIMEETAREEMRLAQRVRSLAGRKELLQKVLERRSLIRGLTTGIGLSISGLGGAYTLYRLGSGVGKLVSLPE